MRNELGRRKERYEELAFAYAIYYFALNIPFVLLILHSALTNVNVILHGP